MVSQVVRGTSKQVFGPWADLQKRFSELQYGHGSRQESEIWRLDLTTFRAQRLIANQRTIDEFAVTADGDRIAMITTPDELIINFEGKSRVDIWDATTGESETKLIETDLPAIDAIDEESEMEMDFDPAWMDAFSTFLCYFGLRHSDGTPKPAWEVWLQEAEEYYQ